MREAVVSYKDRVLTREELLAHLPKNLTPADSTRLSQDYIRRWLREQYVLDVASDSIADLEGRIGWQLADYRRKLIQLELERYLVGRHLDTLVTPAQIVAYQAEHPDLFLARDYYYRVRYVEVPATAVNPEVRTTLASPDSATVVGLAARLAPEARALVLPEQYVPADSLARWQRAAPAGVVLANARPMGPVLAYPGRGGTPGSFHYFYLLEVIRPGNTLPLALVADDIYLRILTERRYKLLLQYETKYTQEAESHPDSRQY